MSAPQATALAPKSHLEGAPLFLLDLVISQPNGPLATDLSVFYLQEMPCLGKLAVSLHMSVCPSSMTFELSLVYILVPQATDDQIPSSRNSKVYTVT